MNKGYTFVLVVLTLVFALIPSVHAEARPAEFARHLAPHWQGSVVFVTVKLIIVRAPPARDTLLDCSLTPLTSRSTVVLPSKSPMLVTSKLMVTTATDFSIHASPAYIAGILMIIAVVVASVYALYRRRRLPTQSTK